MIDSHCHLEQKEYSKDRDKVIEQCKEAGLKAVVSSCARPEDFELTLQIAERFKNYVFACIGLHPEFVKEFSDKDVGELIEKIKENKEKIVGIGEVGLDFHWIMEDKWRERQAELFVRFIKLANELSLPLIIHSRDVSEKTLEIIEKENPKKVYWHMFGDRNILQRVSGNGWYIGLGPLIMRSKNHKKIARDFPLERILLETDSPWFGVKDGELICGEDIKVRGLPLNIKYAAECIAKAKKIDFSKVWEQCGKNAAEFFNLSMKI